MSVPVDRIREVIAVLDAEMDDIYSNIDRHNPMSDYNEGLYNAYQKAVDLLRKVVNEYALGNTGDSPKREPHVRESGDAIPRQDGQAEDAAD